VRHHRQERWLHTRISENLEEALKREARRRRLPVSLLVRNVLEGALDLVEDIVESSLHVARRSQDLARRAGGAAAEDGDPMAAVYGWQELILNRRVTCARCGSVLPVGVTAYRGLAERAGPPVFECVACIRRLRQPAAGGEEESR
jgi:hypothetical protein